MDSRSRDERSRSPYRGEGKPRRQSRRSLARSLQTRPGNEHDSQTLPFEARHLSRHDLHRYRPMFALYLDIQKQLDIDDMDEKEIKGRFKSFISKWNHGDLAEGWYDPQTLEKALKASSSKPPEASSKSDSDRDDFGPALPKPHRTLASDSFTRTKGPGPTIPTASDILAHREQLSEDAALKRQDDGETLKQNRRLDGRLQRSRLDDLVPRAEPGTKERQLEKKREANASNRSFAASANDTGDVDLPDADVLGGADSIDDLKQMKQQQDRKKNEREIRREEIMRARRAEREEKLKALREKEGRTMEMLKEIARERFGGGEG